MKALVTFCTRRLTCLAAVLSAALCVAVRCDAQATSGPARVAQTTGAPSTAPQPLEGTRALTDAPVDLSPRAIQQVDEYLLRETRRAAETRSSRWKRDFSSTAAYLKSVAPQRERLRKIAGVVDSRVEVHDLSLVATLTQPALVADGPRVQVFAVRWPVFPGVEAEGLLVEPKPRPVNGNAGDDAKADKADKAGGWPRGAFVVVPDADQSPEQITGLATTDPQIACGPIARHLGELGFRVLVPTLVDRTDTWSGNPRVRMTNQTHREWVYRQAYYLGRHLIGFEVQKVSAALDYLQRRSAADGTAGTTGTLGVAGYGEGGLIAMYAAAVDERIERTLVSGYFGPREQLWREPVYRNVWGLLRDFGDAEIAGLVAPRRLVVEACGAPEVPGPPPARNGRNDAATGRLTTPELESVRAEAGRVTPIFDALRATEHFQLVVSTDGTGQGGSTAAIRSLLHGLDGDGVPLELDPPELADRRVKFDPRERMRRTVEQLQNHCQTLAKTAVLRRAEYWKDADASSLEKWTESCRPYRARFREEFIGEMPAAAESPAPRTRLRLETPKWRGYDVLLDVWPGVEAYGILLVPKDLKPGERRSVVVAQHGRAGKPIDVVNPDQDTPAYHSFGAKLADQGFIVFAPQNLYLGEEIYRQLQRKATPLKTTFFGPMVRQHEQILKWLSSLPFVDERRIAFYGLSYGGKSAMLLPAAIEKYSLSICSGDFNEEVWKHVSVDDRFSFMFTLEHDHSEFDAADTYNYAEIAGGLIAPRPFMVERGHRDGVAPDEWVAYEFAKVRRRYVELGIGDRATLEFFPGGHEIRLQAALELLRKQ